MDCILCWCVCLMICLWLLLKCVLFRCRWLFMRVGMVGVCVDWLSGFCGVLCVM